MNSYEIFLGFMLIWFVGYFIYYMLTKKSCTASISSGTACSQSCQCKSGACGMTTSSSTVCCPTSKTTTDSSGLVYCAGYPVASPCKTDSMCNSGSCINGKCSPSGSSCTPSTCPTGCGYPDATQSNPKICCPKGTVTVDGVSYCTDSPDGTPCFSLDQCAAGNCYGNSGGAIGKCGFGPPSPPQPKPKFIPCNDPNDCQSGACAQVDPTGQGNFDRGCCPVKSGHMWGGDIYCDNLPAGYSCQSDAFCASGNCNNGVCQ